MEVTHFKNLCNFYVVGINYKKSDASIRGKYAVSETQYNAILNHANKYGLNELFILSTCNRTEIYGFAHSSDVLIDLLCSETSGEKSTFMKAAYIKQGLNAVEHVFEVGAGLDSQILGDYEIVGQLKNAVRFSREKKFIGAFTDRLTNCVLQASKQIKNATELSGGTVSVSFAAVQYLKNNFTDISNKNILLLGIGKIGRNTCKNLVDYLQTKNITLINRSQEKAQQLADELNLKTSAISNLSSEINKADIILVATNSEKPIIHKSHLMNGGFKLIIDLSIPYNVDEEARNLPNVKLINVDELSKLKDETLKKRIAEIPKAKAIIAQLVSEFNIWYEMRRHAPLLKDLKLKLKNICTHHASARKQTTTCVKTIDTQIQRVLNETAGQIKIKNQRGCQYITAINNFISEG